jgi:hypothetical protein
MWVTYNGMVVSLGGSIVKLDPIDTGLILYLDASNTSSYIGSSSSWNDISGFNNNATLINTPTFDSNNGGSIVFDDVSLEYATIPNIGDKSTWTVEVWFKTTSSLVGKCTSVLSNQFNLSTKLNFSIGTNVFPTNSNICAGFYDGAWRTTTGFAPTINTWYQVVGTYDGSAVRQYVNGVASGGTLNYVGTPQSGGEIRLMRRWDSPLQQSNLLDGQLAVAKIYNRALGASEVLSNFNSIKSRFGL